MLFATTSNGVYCCDAATKSVRRILGARGKPRIRKPEARGYFGIALHAPTGQVLVASRERALFRFGKLATDVGLHLIDPQTLRATLLAKVKDVHDVHQIAWHDGCAFLADTGKNRIVVYNPQTETRRAANIGELRKDVNHINAICVFNRCLYVGLNNRAVQPAAVLRLPLAELYPALDTGEADISGIGEYTVLDGLSYTHDLEPATNGKLYACVSYNGFVFEIESRRPLLRLKGWSRGLAFAPDTLWVGTSELAARDERHSEKLDGAISLYSLPDLKLLDRLILRGAGQVNDLLWLDDERDADQGTPSS